MSIHAAVKKWYVWCHHPSYHATALLWGWPSKNTGRRGRLSPMGGSRCHERIPDARRRIPTATSDLWTVKSRPLDRIPFPPNCSLLYWPPLLLGGFIIECSVLDHVRARCWIMWESDIGLFSLHRSSWLLPPWDDKYSLISEKMFFLILSSHDALLSSLEYISWFYFPCLSLK